MILVVTEKNIAAEKIADLLATAGKPKADKVYKTPIYRFTHEGEEWVSIGLRGHILAVDFPLTLTYDEKNGWSGVDAEGEVIPADLPDSLAKPPFKKRKPFVENGVELKAWKVPSLPYLVYAPIVKTPAEKEIIRALKNLAKKADRIIIATDYDREGELIGSDAVTMIREVNETAPISRARYSALTKGEVTAAFDDLVEVDEALAAAGESRQFIDLIWGAILTRYLTMAKFGGFGNVRSAGRVQTPTLALVVEREKERLAFVPEDYWVIRAQLDSNGTRVKADHATARFKEEAAANAAFAASKDEKTAAVTEIKRTRRRQQPPTPFNTTALQAAAAAEGLSPARTMRIAESLYMNGLISYPRVDNTVYPDSLDLAGTLKTLTGVPQYAPYAKKLLGGKLTPTRGKKETTDHPPIHPTGAGDPDKLSPQDWKLYNLVARRFMATLSGPATIEGTKVSLDIGGEPFNASGDVIVSPGFREIYPYGQKKDEQLPAIEEGDTLDIEEVTLEAKQTEPPSRFSQARLIQEMEKRGLGTKSTRHSIIERLYNVKYLKNDPIEPSQLGIAIVDALTSFAPHVTSPEMTSQLEEEMDRITEGRTSQEVVVDHSRDMLADMLTGLIENKEKLGEAISDAVTADARVGACPKCGSDLLVKNSAKTRSQFVGCAAWPDCDVTFPLPKGKIDPEEEPCPTCGSPQIKVRPFRQKAYTTCIDPACPTNKEPDVIVGTCPVCAEAGRKGDLVGQKSERTLKRFIRCTNYELCEVSYPLPQRGKLVATGKTCDECGAPVVIIQTERGPWEICVNMDCPSKEKKTTKKRTTKKAPAKKK